MRKAQASESGIYHITCGCGESSCTSGRGGSVGRWRSLVKALMLKVWSFLGGGFSFGRARVYSCLPTQRKISRDAVGTENPAWP